MKNRLFFLVSASLLAGSPAAFAAKEPEAPVPVMKAPSVQEEQPRQAENQRLYGPSSPSIIPAEQAQGIVERFKAAYEKLGSPRIVFSINRELVDTNSGLKLTGRTEKYEEAKSEAKSEVKTSGENAYAMKEATKPALNDRQTTREVERLFGRAFRASGASLADQKIAADLIGDKPVGNLTGTNDQAAKDREALGKVADVAVEILISSRTITIPGISSDQQVTVPDIQVTAIRLKDAAIIGQAASSDILGRNGGRVAQQFSVQDITEATALALMEDITSSAK